MYANILGRRYQIKFVPLQQVYGLCDAPDKLDKTITIDSRLAGEAKLTILLHECLHAAYWHLDEEYVNRAAKDIARLLWRLGYRLKNEDTE